MTSIIDLYLEMYFNGQIINDSIYYFFKRNKGYIKIFIKQDTDKMSIQYEIKQKQNVKLIENSTCKKINFIIMDIITNELNFPNLNIIDIALFYEALSECTIDRYIIIYLSMIKGTNDNFDGIHSITDPKEKTLIFNKLMEKYYIMKKMKKKNDMITNYEQV